ncbi:hypothetical protein V6Z98_009964 [Aspergillus fumigatus]
MLLGSWLASNLEADVSNLEFDHETTPSPHENSMQPWQVPKPNAYQLGQFYATEIALWVEGRGLQTYLDKPPQAGIDRGRGGTVEATKHKAPS